MHSRFTVGATLVVVGALSLSACGGGSSNDDGASQGPAQDANAPITIWVDDTRAEPAETYAKAHPELNATVKSVDNTHGNISSQIALAVRAQKDVPDVVFLSYPDEIANLVVNPVNYAEPLDATVGEDQLAKFAEGSMAACTFGGKTYCLPNDLAQTVLFYDKATFEEFGYTVPTTFDEWLALGQKVATEHPGYSLGSVNTRYGLNAYYGSSGCKFSTSTDPTKVSIDVDSTECTRVNDVVGPLLANGTLTGLDPFDAAFTPVVKGGKLLATISPTWMGEYGIKPNFAATGQWAVAPMPTWDGASDATSGAVGGGIFVLSASSKNKANAAKFALAMTTDPAIQSESSGYPADTASAEVWLQKVAKDPWYASDPTQVFKDAAAKISPTLSFVRYQVQAEEAFTSTIVKDKGADTPAALKSFGEQLDSAAQSSGYTIEGK